MCGTSRNFIDYPSSKLGRKTPSTTPPSNSQNFIDYPTELHRLPPPSKSGRKTPSTTPLEFTELHRLPPLEIGPENSFNYPPLEFTELHLDYLFRLRSWWNALERCLESVPTVKNSHFNHWFYVTLRLGCYIARPKILYPKISSSVITQC